MCGGTMVGNQIILIKEENLESSGRQDLREQKHYLIR